MISAFGVDHGEISKAFGGSILGAGSKLSHTPGAGGVAASKLAGGGRRSAVNYKAFRGSAKKSGKRAAQQFRQLGTPKTYGGYEGAHPGVRSANEGWSSKIQASSATGASSAGKTPVGMRGPVKSRVKTTAMRANEKNFN
jgi:hypothetical protein